MCKHTPGFFNLCTCETLKAVTLKVAGKIVQGQRRENSNTLRKKNKIMHLTHLRVLQLKTLIVQGTFEELLFFFLRVYSCCCSCFAGFFFFLYYFTRNNVSMKFLQHQVIISLLVFISSLPPPAPNTLMVSLLVHALVD